MVINLSPPEFQRKLQALRTKNVKLLDNGKRGMIVNDDVTLGYSYDGKAALTITILQKHSLRAHIASEGTIDDHITDLFATL